MQNRKMRHSPNFGGWFVLKQKGRRRCFIIQYYKQLKKLPHHNINHFSSKQYFKHMKSSASIFLSMLVASLLGGAISLGGYKFFVEETREENFTEKQQVVFSKYANDTETAHDSEAAKPARNYNVPKGLNFVNAAEKVTPAVVHIKTTYQGNAAQFGRHSIEDMFKEFFGDRSLPRDYGNQGKRMSSGSGVIITTDGYIATNNHVVEHANSIEVVLNDKRSYPATIIGRDPTTDLALLKVEGKNLPFVPFGNSDAVKIGEWVLAVGNPFDLTSTVTAGIVSAKARNINILRGRNNYSVESFIQTDAAVNPGNSGGALVDLDGKLVGINTAIATQTGSYSGYSFAVPVTLVKKVMDDLLNYGEVQRALMGVNILDVNAKLAKEKNIDKIEGVYIAGVNPGSGADDAGILSGDIILSINGTKVNTSSALQEIVARNHPGDEIDVKIKRDGEIENVRVTLKNKQQTTEIIRKADKKEVEISELGASFQDIDPKKSAELQIPGGVEIVSLKGGKLKAANIQEGFIITHINQKSIRSVEELQQLIPKLSGGTLLQGVYPNGQNAYYGIGF